MRRLPYKSIKDMYQLLPCWPWTKFLNLDFAVFRNLIYIEILYLIRSIILLRLYFWANLINLYFLFKSSKDKKCFLEQLLSNPWGIREKIWMFLPPLFCYYSYKVFLFRSLLPELISYSMHALSVHTHLTHDNTLRWSLVGESV